MSYYKLYAKAQAIIREESIDLNVTANPTKGKSNMTTAKLSEYQRVSKVS